MTSDERVLGGRYRLGSPIGRGGMADVRRGFDLQLGREVAVKLLRPELAADAAARRRFGQEARSMATLEHPNIVAVLDSGDDPDPETGRPTPYIVMEFVDGRTLASLLRRGERFPTNRALALTRELLDALAHSHDAGLVHQDIKPGNVMMSLTGTVKVMDFGIARGVADAAPDGCLPEVRGSVRYLSPEQARGEATDARSDIYSVGCLLYELLVGRPPFVGETVASIVQQQLEQAPLLPSSLNDTISADIDAIVARSLAKDPDQRYRSAAEMNAAIAEVLGVVQTRPVIVSADSHLATRAGAAMPGPRRAAIDQPPAAATTGPSRARRLLLAGGCAVAFLGFGALVAYDYSSGPASMAGGPAGSTVLSATQAKATSRSVAHPNVRTVTMKPTAAASVVGKPVARARGQSGAASTQSATVSWAPASRHSASAAFARPRAGHHSVASGANRGTAWSSMGSALGSAVSVHNPASAGKPTRAATPIKRTAATTRGKTSSASGRDSSTATRPGKPRTPARVPAQTRVTSPTHRAGQTLVTRPRRVTTPPRVTRWKPRVPSRPAAPVEVVPVTVTPISTPVHHRTNPRHLRHQHKAKTWHQPGAHHKSGHRAQSKHYGTVTSNAPPQSRGLRRGWWRRTHQPASFQAAAAAPSANGLEKARGGQRRATARGARPSAGSPRPPGKHRRSRSSR